MQHSSFRSSFNWLLLMHVLVQKSLYANKAIHTHTHIHPMPSLTSSHINLLSCAYQGTCVHTCVLSHFSQVQLFVTLWAIACHAPRSTGFSRQVYWCRLLCPPPGNLPNPGIKPMSFMPPALAGRFFTTSTTWGAHQGACHPLKSSCLSIGS